MFFKLSIRAVLSFVAFLGCVVFAKVSENVELTDANWGPMNRTLPPGTNGKIYGMASYGTTVYVCGSFTLAGGIKVKTVAKWDGSTWSSVGYEGSVDESGANMVGVDNKGTLYVVESFYEATSPTSRAAIFVVHRRDKNGWGQCARNKGIIRTICADSSGNMYVGGQFDTIGELPAKNIAKWNGNEWDSLQSGLYTPESYPEIRVIVTDPSGILYAGGNFTIAGGVPVKSVAKWDGSKWDSLQSGVSGTIYSMAINSTGELCVGGDVFWNAIKWDGSRWEPLGRPRNESTATTVVLFDSRDTLYAGGEKNSSGVTDVIEKWDGTEWLPVGIMPSDVPASYMQVKQLVSNSNGTIYAAGEFEYAGKEKVCNIAKYNGSQWSALGTGFDGAINKLIVDSTGNLFATGEFTTIVTDNDSACGVAKWNGTAWSPLGTGTGSVYSFSDAIAIAEGSTLFISSSTEGVLQWDGESWTTTKLNYVSSINDMAVDGNGTLYCTAYDNMASGKWIQNIKKREAGRWVNLRGSFNGEVYTLLFDSLSNLYVGGHFNSAVTAMVNNIAQWDGENWTDMGTQHSQITDCVRALLLAPDGMLYAGGFFDSTGGTPTNNIAMWNGSSWNPLGAGVDSTVHALAVDEDGTLYAGGDFKMAGDVEANHIARWNGEKWSPIGSGTDGKVNALAIYKSVLYAGGAFMNAGNHLTPYVAGVNLQSAWNLPVKHIPQKTIAGSIYFTNRTLHISNVLGKDNVRIYSLSGQLLRQQNGAGEMNLGGLSPQILLACVVRNGKQVYTRAILMR